MTQQAPETPEPEQNWLQQQWQRVRQLYNRDVVIGQVGEGATNVIIGKNNVQFNVAGRNLTLPVYVIATVLLIFLGVLLFRLVVEPIWWPSQMTGTYRIAIANFGELNDNGRVRATAQGRAMSKWFFDNLFNEYETSTIDVAQTIEIWHDLRPDIDKNVRFGIMRGDTAAKREEAAAALASRIGAHMVVYGNLVNDEQGLPRLDLAFYLSPRVNDETNAIVGPHRLSKPLALPATFDIDSPDASTSVSRLLKVRTDAFFWLTVGLTLAIEGRSEEALNIFRVAETELADWREEDGKEILYFFIGREELLLGNVEQAEAEFRRALAINPSYARAHVGLGSALLRQARQIPPTKRLESPDPLLTQALDVYLTALTLAAEQGELLVIDVANLALAKGYRLLGETYFHLAAWPEARQFFALTREKVDQVIPSLTAASQFRLVAQAHETMGAAYLQEGVLALEQNDTATARTLLEGAQQAYTLCIAQGRQIIDDVLNEQIVQRCEQYTATAVDYLDQIEGGES